MFVLVRKMVVLARRCKALFLSSCGWFCVFIVTMPAKGSASKSLCRDGGCACLHCHAGFQSADRRITG